MMKTLPSFHYSLDDDGTAVTIPGSRGFVPPPILLQRSPPSYGETSTSRQVANLDGHVQSEDQGVRPKSSLLPVAGLSSEEGYKSQLSSSAFDEFIIEGYEHVTYETTLIKPPPPEPISGDGDSSSRRGNAAVPNIDDLTARDAVLSYVSQNRCWGLACAREMTIMDITASSAFHYNLETCTEKRTAVWIHEPYTGQVIDSADRGPSPKPWDVLVVPPNPYREGQIVVEVPHSARVVNCYDCSTMGRRRCWSCFGNGEIQCNACNGTGKILEQESGGASEAQRANAPVIPKACYQCGGGGKRRCVVCLGPGQLPCKTCLARGQLKLSLQLTVSWRLYKSDRIVERTAVPELLIRSVQGRVAFDEEKAAVWPINFFPDEAVNHASRELLDEHRARLSSEKTIAQRQSVRMVPVHQVAYVWRNYRGFFYIYGYDNLVHFPDYPQKACCGLSELLSCSIQ